MSYMKYPILIRVLHYYSSMACCFLFAFYAVSGFLATHADDFIGESRPAWEERIVDLPKDGLDDSELRRAFCKRLLENAETVRQLEHDDFDEWFVVSSTKESVRCIVGEEQVDIRPLFTFDDDVAPDDMPLWIAGKHGGHIENLEIDDEYMRQTFDLASVWFQGEVIIHQDLRMYELKQRKAHIIRAIVDIHRGKHENWFQTLLADLTAILLFFVIVSGALIGIQIKKRRTMGVLGLAVSLFLTVALMLFR